MNRKNIYRDIHASLIRFCRDFGDQHQLDFVNLDASTDANKWPKNDFMGMGELNVEMMETDEVTVTFAVSTRDDANLLKLAELVNHLTNLLIPGSAIMVYDADTGFIKAALYVANGVKVAAPMDTVTQPIQPVMVRLLSDHRNV